MISAASESLYLAISGQAVPKVSDYFCGAEDEYMDAA